MNVLLTRTLSGLAPADEAASAVLRKIDTGATVIADVRRPRNLSAHRRWWALVNLIYTNSDTYPSPDVVHCHLKLLAGCADAVTLKGTGEVVLVPKSMSFSSMDEDAFQEVWKRAVHVVAEQILPGITEQDVEQEIMQLIGAGSFR